MKSTTIALLVILILQISEREKEVLACGQLQTALIPLLTKAHTTHRWPWHVAVYHRVGESIPTYKCGGTLISSSSVLTAAHCVLVLEEYVVVSLGRWQLDATESSAPFIKVAEIIRHPKYYSQNEDHDIAVIILATNAIFNSYVQPVCLWRADKTDLSEIVGKYGTVVGWGFTENGQVSNKLRQASLPVVNITTCLQSNRDLFGYFLSDTNFCAGNRNGTSVCTGDSGGSMTFELNGRFYIRGIVSVGASKINRETQEIVCDPMQFAIFTDVAQNLPWIRSSAKIEDCAKTVRCDWSSNNRHCTIALQSNTNTAECRIIFDEIPNLGVTELTITGESDVLPDLSDVVAKFRNLNGLVLANVSLKVIERVRLTPFTTIERLDLSSNSISELDAADTFDDLSNLSELNITANKLRELHPNLFKRLNNLETLTLFDNNLTTLPADIFRNNRRLRTLTLSVNQLKELPADLFDNLINIETLAARRNRLEKLPSDIFRSNGKLRELGLGENQLSELPADLFDNLINLEMLYAHSNRFEILPAGIFRSNGKLRHLELSTNQLSELHGDLFESLINLEAFYAHTNRLESLPAGIFRNNGKMRALSISRNQLKELHADLFRELHNLQEIYLNHNQLETIPPGLFRNNENLSEIYLSYNKIKKIDPSFQQMAHAAVAIFDLRDNVCINELCNPCDALSRTKIFDNIQQNCSDKNKLDARLFWGESLSTTDKLWGMTAN